MGRATHEFKKAKEEISHQGEEFLKAAEKTAELVFGKESLVSHFEALRKTLLKCIVATALGYPVGYWITPDVINQLIQWSFPENIGKLHYFPP